MIFSQELQDSIVNEHLTFSKFFDEAMGSSFIEHWYWGEKTNIHEFQSK